MTDAMTDVMTDVTTNVTEEITGVIIGALLIRSAVPHGDDSLNGKMMKNLALGGKAAMLLGSKPLLAIWEIEIATLNQKSLHAEKVGDNLTHLGSRLDAIQFLDATLSPKLRLSLPKMMAFRK